MTISLNSHLTAIFFETGAMFKLKSTQHLSTHLHVKCHCYKEYFPKVLEYSILKGQIISKGLDFLEFFQKTNEQICFFGLTVVKTGG